mgnify:FL=1
MYKKMLIMFTALSVSHVALAEKEEIFNCIDATSLTIQEDCVADTFEKNSFNDNFYSQIAEKNYETKNDAFATITYYPKLNLIEVKSMESRATLIASR